MVAEPTHRLGFAAHTHQAGLIDLIGLDDCQRRVTLFEGAPQVGGAVAPMLGLLGEGLPGSLAAPYSSSG